MSEYKVVHEGTVVLCATADAVVELMQKFKEANLHPTGYLVARVPPAYAQMDDATRLEELLKHIRGRKQHSYLKEVVENRNGLSIDGLRTKLGIENVFAFNGVWSGLARNAKKFGLTTEMLIVRTRLDNGEILHAPTEFLLSARDRVLNG